MLVCQNVCPSHRSNSWFVIFIQPLRMLWITSQAKNSARKAYVSSALTKSCTLAITRILTNADWKGTQRRTKVSFGRTMMQVLDVLWFAKSHILGQLDIAMNGEEIKPVYSYSHYRITVV